MNYFSYSLIVIGIFAGSFAIILLGLFGFVVHYIRIAVRKYQHTTTLDNGYNDYLKRSGRLA